MTVKPIEVPDWIRSAIIIDPTDIWGNLVSASLGGLKHWIAGVTPYDTRGDPILIDTFESGMEKGDPLGDGALYDVEISSFSCKQGGLSLKLTAGSDGSRYAEYLYWLPYPVLSKVGLEVSFTVEVNTEYVVFCLLLYDGTNYHIAKIRYDEDNNKVQYWDSAGAWQDLITSVILRRGWNHYHTLKMVVDLENDKYHRVMVDGWSWLTGNLSIQSNTSGVSKRFYAELQHYGAAGTNAKSYLDNIIITQNEPA